MAVTNIHRVRAGNPLPVLGKGTTSTGAIMYIFGNECQEVITCSNDDTPVSSSEMCLMGGVYWSASYKALPSKVSGKVKYNATLTKKPVIGLSVQCANSGNCSLISFA